MGCSIFPTITLPVFALIIAITGSPLSVQARESEMPHLIQTVTEQDVFEGMLALDLFKTPVLETEDCAKAYENVKSCVVRIQMGNAHGSGIIWEITPEKIVVATNKHVLEYWRDEDSYVYFEQGHYADAAILGVSDQYDVGFLAIDTYQFSYEDIEKFRTARINEEIYEKLRLGDEMFSVDSASDTEEAEYFEATVGDTHMYIEYFDAYMLYGYGFAKEGMSGGGTFDGRGYLIGMTTGGTYWNETAGVPLPDIVEAYEEIVQMKSENMAE
ncbi:MAG: serine protease [Lachnospiraceae bacterium]|nr:serine protease [Lachnospiraceae bacterium]